MNQSSENHQDSAHFIWHLMSAIEKSNVNSCMKWAWEKMISMHYHRLFLDLENDSKLSLAFANELISYQNAIFIRDF